MTTTSIRPAAQRRGYHVADGGSPLHKLPIRSSEGTRAWRQDLSESVFQTLFQITRQAHEGHVPKFLYSALPLVYLCSGVLTVVLLWNWMAVFSGLTWIAAAGIVWKLRSRYRGAFDDSGRVMDVPESADGHDDARGLARIVWMASLECGHPMIDAQHRRLFGLGNELIKAVSTNKPRGDIAWLFDELIHHITDHFCTEEAVRAKTRHPLSEDHKEIHRMLLFKAADFRGQFHRGDMAIRDLAAFIVYDVIVRDITIEDLKRSNVS
jgi:hemerythrin-like metal-binding protein